VENGGGDGANLPDGGVFDGGMVAPVLVIAWITAQKGTDGRCAKMLKQLGTLLANAL
jgi:hypothetical protein